MSDEHNRTGYQRGCRCDVCVKANSDYRKDLRRRRRAGTVQGRRPLAAVPSVEGTTQSQSRGSVPQPDESVLEAVRAELALLSTPATKPGLAAGALAMARILDDPLALATHPAAMARLSEALATLGKGASNRRGKLSVVKAMTTTDAAK